MQYESFISDSTTTQITGYSGVVGGWSAYSSVQNIQPTVEAASGWGMVGEDLSKLSAAVTGVVNTTAFQVTQETLDNSADAAYKSLESQKFDTLWANAQYQKLSPIAQGAQTGLQSIGVALDSRTYVNILDAAVRGDITQDRSKIRKNEAIHR